MQHEQLNSASGTEAAGQAVQPAQTGDDRRPNNPPNMVLPTEADPLAHVRHAARFVIIGQTADGRTFRPSDWAERLAGVMAGFRPGGPSSARSPHTQAHLGYSPYVSPSTHGGFKCVIVDARLHDIEPLAHHFVLNFALDNRLKVESLD